MNVSVEERVRRAMAVREAKKRATKLKAREALRKLKMWANRGHEIEFDLSGVGKDDRIPEGSLAHHLSDPSTCNALAKVSDDPGLLLGLLLAFEQQQKRNSGGDRKEA